MTTVIQTEKFTKAYGAHRGILEVALPRSRESRE